MSFARVRYGVAHMSWSNPRTSVPPEGRERAVRALVVGFSFGLIAVAGKLPINAVAGGDVGLLPLVIGVGVATWYGGRIAGVMATAISAVADSWLQALHGGAAAAAPQHWAGVFLYLVVGLASAVVIDMLRVARATEAAEAVARDRLNAALAEREARLAELLEQEREATLQRDAFVDIVSHELRTPITVVVASARLLSRDADRLPSADAALVREIEAGSDRLERLVQDLVVLVRSERGAVPEADDPVRLAPVIARAVAAEAARWPELTFTSLIDDALPVVSGSEGYLEQVLGNLLSNAAKYNRPSGTVRVLASADAHGVSVRVQDDGPGIVDAESDRLFDLYYRSGSTSGAAAGSGIGLYVSRQLARAMGGDIRARRRPEGGSEFEVRLRAYDVADDEAYGTPVPVDMLQAS